MSGNPFKQRWDTDNPEFIKLRKKQWRYVKPVNFDTHYTLKEQKKLKIFFLQGDWPDGISIKATLFLCWTPSKSKEQIGELLDFLATRRKGKDYIESVNILAALGGPRGADDSPYSFALGNEALIAEVVLGDNYSNENYSSTDVPRHFPPQEFVLKYEGYLKHHLTSVDPNVHAPVSYALEFYLSCIRYLEALGETVQHHQCYENILSTAFNFTEGGQVVDDPPSKIGEFAALFRERLTKGDIPSALKHIVSGLGPNHLIEYRRNQSADYQVYVLDDLQNPGGAFGLSPYPRVIRGCAPGIAIKAFWQAAISSGLIPGDEPFPTISQVDIAGLLSEPLVNELGYSIDEAMPAYRFTLWYQPEIRIANHKGAEFGADLILIVPKNEMIIGETTSVIYYPRLNSYYDNWIPTSVLFLKDRQVRRGMWELTGKHLYQYSDAWFEEEKRFMESPNLDPGYEVFSDFKLNDINHSIIGPNTSVWAGSALPQIDLKEIFNNGDTK